MNRPQAHPAKDAEPGWLAAWRAGMIDGVDAMARFDSLPGLEPEAMLGQWRGVGLATGHPIDGLLEALGWHGKAFEGLDRVHPLLFRTRSGEPIAIDPARLPVRLALRWPGLARSSAAGAAFAAVLPLLRARRSTARLRQLDFRGKPSAAMAYDGQPIIDYFRSVGGERVLGLMVLRGRPPPLFFLLYRDPQAS